MTVPPKFLAHHPIRITLILATGLEALILFMAPNIDVAAPQPELIVCGFGYALCLSFLSVGILLSICRNRLTAYWIASAVIPAAGLLMAWIGWQSTPEFLFSPQFAALRQFVLITGLLWLGTGCLLAAQAWINVDWRRSADQD